MKDDTTTGQRIRELRKARGWTQHDLSQRTGIHTSSLCHLERGHGALWPGHLAKIARALDVSTDELRGAA
jgi:transcriptional regulator with XRE-family HTH domain